MAGQRITVDAHVLLKEETGESHLRFRLLTAEKGGLLCLARRPSNRSRAPLPDLFDFCRLDLEQPVSSHSWFLRDCRILKRHDGLARNYKAFAAAAAVARTVSLNLAHLEVYEPVCRIVDGMLDALERGADPEVVQIKALYRFAAAEGYPVLESWLLGQSAARQQQLVTLLRQPSPDRAPSEWQTRKALDDLHAFLDRETDIRTHT